MTGELMNSGEMEVELVPQGTLVERIRAGGYGLGGVLTPTGVGTMVAEGKEIITIKGKEYLLEMPLKADIAILSGSIVDTFGNTYYKGTTRNFNPIMAMAAEHVIVEAEQLVEPSDIDPECIMTPGVLVDYILKGGVMMIDKKLGKQIIARRVARELQHGQLVNLGIGLPTKVANYIPEGIEVIFQSENGMVGMGKVAAEGKEDERIINAGGDPVTILPNGAYFDSAMSFGLIRGGHVDLTVLGALQVDAKGNLASWIIPGKLVPGMGGAMDLVTGLRK